MSQIRNYAGATPITYDQHSIIKRKSPGQTLRTGFDWSVAPKQTVGFLFNGSLNNMNGTIVSEAYIMVTGSSKIDSTTLTNTRPSSRFNSQMYNLNYRFDGDKSGVFTTDLDYGRVYNQNKQNLKNHYLNADGSELHTPTEFQYNGPRNIDIYSLKSDYTKPLTEHSNLDAGLKIGQTITDNEIRYENFYDGVWVNDPNQINRFKYNEQISAVYITFSHRFDKFSTMAGLRAEYTSTKGESVTMDTTFTRNYLDWFPSVNLQYQIKEGQVLNFSYSRKINRPGYSMLNPFRTYSDLYTFFSGNPDLKPEYRNTTALTNNLKGYSSTLTYSGITDLFSQDYIQDDENRIMGVIQSNLGQRKQWTWNVFAPFQVVKWYNVSASTEVSYTMSDTYHSGERFLNNYWSVVAGLFHNFNFSPTFKANLQMIWSKPPWSGILLMDNIWLMNSQIEKTFLDNRMSLSLTCNDIFSSLRFSGQMKFGNINQSIKQFETGRTLMLTARYSFGSQQIRGARNRNMGIEEEMGRAR
jgi:outer membrane receptor protein involved in Fe transport